MTRYSLSWAELAGLVTTIIKMPLAITWDLIGTALKQKRISGISKPVVVRALRRLNETATISQLQLLAGDSREVYESWAARQRLDTTIEDLVDETYLYWIGPKRRDKVVLYVPGGGFFAPLTDSALSFWNYTRVQLKGNHGLDAGFVALHYSLLPGASFPTQLRQLAVAIDHLVATGTHARNIFLVGDSAGGNLILQLLSQLLHPMEQIGPISKLSEPCGGVYLMSPWVTFESISSSYTQTRSDDFVNGKSLTEWSKLYTGAVADSQKAYIEFLKSSTSWFQGVSTFAGRFLVSVGGEERFRDDVVEFVESRLAKVCPDVQLEIQEGGVHNDPYYDFMAWDRPTLVSSLSPVIISWLKDGLKKSVD
ncbi:alpha/beta hydrolase fold protein [Coprinopsis cinerea okayama7|uniref:Alpha/beta hydrolase fold protein n=1 Tax=Coprinopsis cinerea (strain Okayama-7 / 130 / ATCC MYA-4618 / FGSC 9003) TaxID=240176 RepID=A8NKB8_COPC7|nr:alpha/beta hydrolase fold protein [Coprinopsis cinerea okayama7\|eukprot:XP_001834404.2 alpha/beta hydrolase fold protein [Coprinopsis cinerea okayama7\